MSGRTDSMPWSPWSLTVQNCKKLNQTATRLLQQMETSVEDPIIADNTAMTRAERRLSGQTYCVLALTCREKALQVGPTSSQRFRVRGMKTAVHRIRATSSAERSQGMFQALLSQTKSHAPVRTVRQRGNGLKVCEEQSSDRVSDLQPGRPLAWDLPHQEVTECHRARQMCEASGSTDPQNWLRSVRKRAPSQRD